jgi:hypothetical protein
MYKSKKILSVDQIKTTDYSQSMVFFAGGIHEIFGMCFEDMYKIITGCQTWR